jgi:tetratricopeptide (TPR) repeat protein
MIALTGPPLRNLRRRPWLALLIPAVLASIGYGAVMFSRQARAEIHLRAAQRELVEADHAQRRSHLANASAELGRCLELRPESADVRFLAAQTARRVSDFADAERQLREAEQLGWVAQAIELERALQRAQQGDLATVATPLLSFVERDHPDKALILEALTQGFMDTYQLPRAVDCLNRWLAIQPDNAQALAWRGQAQVLLGRREQALADYRWAAELDADDNEVAIKLGEMLRTLRRVEEAQAQFTRLRQRQPDNPEVLLGLARCEAELGRLEEAVATLDELLADSPADAGALAERGKIELEAGRPAAAEPWLRKSLSRAPFERVALYNLYLCLQSQKRADEARQYLATIERIDADRERLDRLKKAVMAAPQDVKLRREMGEILLRNGQETEGRRWLASALKANPKDGPTHAALADHYEHCGEHRLAAYHRQQAGATNARPESP